MSGVTFANVTGTGLSNAMNYCVLCGSGSCSDFSMTGVSITGGGGTECNCTAGVLGPGYLAVLIILFVNIIK